MKKTTYLDQRKTVTLLKMLGFKPIDIGGYNDYADTTTLELKAEALIDRGATPIDFAALYTGNRAVFYLEKRDGSLELY